MSIYKLFGNKASQLEDNVDISGAWKNQFKSSMKIVVDDSGQISGTYKTGKGAPSEEEEFPIVGFVSGDLVSFTVNFGKYGSLTSWAGQLTIEDGKEVIKTSWLLAKNILDEKEDEDLWGAILTGADTFSRPD